MNTMEYTRTSWLNYLKFFFLYALRWYNNIIVETNIFYIVSQCKFCWLGWRIIIQQKRSVFGLVWWLLRFGSCNHSEIIQSRKHLRLSCPIQTYTQKQTQYTLTIYFFIPNRRQILSFTTFFFGRNKWQFCEIAVTSIILYREWFYHAYFNLGTKIHPHS